MSALEYLRRKMQSVSNIIYNASQGDSVTKDMILDSLIRMVEDYNSAVDVHDRINVTDFRKRV